LSHALRHRHALVAPLFALVVVGSSAASPLQASIMPQQVKILAEGLHAIMLDDVTFDDKSVTPRLVEGSLIVFADRPLFLGVGSAVVSMQKGGAYVRAHQGNISVAALTTPVWLQMDTEYTVVPVYRQWQGLSLPSEEVGIHAWWDAHKTQSVSIAFLREHLSTLKRFEHFSADQLEMAWPTTDASAELLHLLAFPSADRLYESPASARAAYATLVDATLNRNPPHVELLSVLQKELVSAVTWSKKEALPIRVAFYEELSNRVSHSLAELPSVTSSSAVSSARSSASSDAACVPMTGSGEEEAATIFLTSLKAAYTTKTSITAESEELVRVKDIVLSDRLLSFTLNTTCGLVSDISEQGNALPFGLSVDAFKSWLTK